MSEKLVNFRFEEEKYNDLKMLALKERKPVKTLLSDLIDDYLKIHKDGNPQYTIDQFEDPDFKATPAFYRPLSVWEDYAKTASAEELEGLKTQILGIEKRIIKYL